MISFLWIGTVLGAFAGLFHGVQVCRQQIAATGSRAAGLYYGAWAIALWTLFGAYILAFWILGAVAYSVTRLVPQSRGSAALASD